MNHFVLRLGGFHALETYWKIMGKRYSGASVDDILIEPGVIGPNAMGMVMKG